MQEEINILKMQPEPTLLVGAPFEDWEWMCFGVKDPLIEGKKIVWRKE
jgi:hypothetical protein